MTWRDPWHARYHVFALRPEVVLACEYSSKSATAYTVTNITAGAVANVKKDMTVVAGTAAGLTDRGRARILADGAGSDIYIYAPLNVNDGEFSHLTGGYFTVWNDYRVWMKLPRVASAAYYYDYNTGSVGATTDQVPIANGGPGYAGFVSTTTGKATVSFDGYKSFGVANDGILGAYAAQTLTGLATSSSGTAANAVDSDTGTYCQFASSDDDEYIQIDFGSGNEKRIRKITITCHTTYNAMDRLIVRAGNGSGYCVVYFEEGISGWGTPSTKTFYIQDVGEYRYWRIYPHDTGSTCRVYEIGMSRENRSSGTPYSWDIDDGVVTVGSTSSETLTATFRAGFRWVDLTVTDSNAQEHTHHIPVATCTGRDGQNIVTAGSSKTQSSYITGTASAMFDDNTLTKWDANLIPGPEWGQITLANESGVIGYYDIYVASATYAPKSWTVQADTVTVDTQTDITDWEDGETKRFYLDPPIEGTVWRITVSASNYVPYPYEFRINEWILTEYYPTLDCTIDNHVMEPSGQTIELGLQQALDESDYPDGTLVMVWQNEYYDMTQGSLSNAGPTDREHMVFVGWIDEEPTEIGDYIERPARTSLRCIDVGKKLQLLTDFTLIAEKDSAPGASLGYQMDYANMDKLIYLVLEWLSTGASLSDFTWSNTADQYNFGVQTTQGANIFEAINQKAVAMGHLFTCNKHGQLNVYPDPFVGEIYVKLYRDYATWETLTAADYTAIEFTRQRNSRYHWVQGSGVTFNSYDADSGSLIASAYLAQSPDIEPGQGSNTMDLDGMLISYPREIIGSSGAFFAYAVGNAYQRLQAHNSILRIHLGHNGDNGLDPAELTRDLKLTVPAAAAAQRGQTRTTASGVIKRISINYDHELLSRKMILDWEELVDGHVADITYQPE